VSGVRCQVSGEEGGEQGARNAEVVVDPARMVGI
jgi:hypothetical protein